MRLSFRFLMLLVPSLALVILGFVTVMDRLERRWVQEDLDRRSTLVSESIQEEVLESLSSGRSGTLVKLLNRISRDSRLAGIVVCTSDGKLRAKSFETPRTTGCTGVSSEAGGRPRMVTEDGEVYHRAVTPLIAEGDKQRGYLIILHSPAFYMESHGLITRRYAVFAFFILVLLISVVTVLVARWSASQPMEQVIRAVGALLKGDISKISALFANTEWAPLVKDLDRVLLDLRRGKTGNGENAPNVWTPARLRAEVQRLFGDSRLCIIANREPYIHNRKGKRIEAQFPASGLVTAVEPIVRACSGLWIGHGSGSADRETADKRGIILVPPGDKPDYALKRVWLTREEEQGYYYGFSNEGIWPLCHIAHTRPLFRVEDWNHYVRVNQRFADAFAEEMKSPGPIALIQDYHFALLPEMLRNRRPDAVTSLFWHIPWPNPEVIRICPWKAEILKGMLGSDLIGFHTQYHCNNFLDTVDRFLEARVDRESYSVTIQGHTCFVKPFPISVEWPSRHQVPAEKIPEVRARLLEELSIPPDTLIGLGVDRLDYTKGIVERLLAVERMLEQHPELTGKFVFIQISAPSRTHIKRYQELDSEVREVASRINYRFHRPGIGDPILLRISHHDAGEVFRYYLAADVCVVSSLHDGMNLVAKEYIAARNDNGGALVLSSFTGAARELTDALIVNPYDIEETAKAIYKGISMGDEMAQRMARLRAQVGSRNVYAWAARFLGEVHRIVELRQSRGLPAATG